MSFDTDFKDTIAAVATPPGRGGVGMVRISGLLTPAIAEQILGKLPAPRRAHYAQFRAAHGALIDSGIALYFPAPHSFTGEHVLELHGHGGPLVLDMLLRRAVELGARLARPGEFSERAFLNGKIDLAQAEAIADLIDSHSEQAARAAMRSLQGEFSARVNGLVEQLTRLRVYVEAAIDFPEEEIDFLADAQIAARLQSVREEFDALLRAAQQGSLLREGVSVVIAGLPNAGKSSLLNSLAGRDAAIVTAIPGTTRDVLREYIHIDGLPLHVIDTAGLRESRDPIEQEGVRRARAEIARADRVLFVTEHGAELDAQERALIEQLPPRAALTVVHNKIDLRGEAPRVQEAAPARAEIWLSAKSGAGVELLRAHLKSGSGYQDNAEGVFSARRRHLDALQRARAALDNGARQLRERRAGELLAEELRVAQSALGEITGAVSSEDLLGKIFSSFCIGK
ncbi:MAG: tRNA uridine-5-carboxymethylaminomethyl(34) synthesis GTPase MnmE [Pseudomonadota bacterium]